MATELSKGKLSEPDSNYCEQSYLWKQVRACIAGKYEVDKLVDCLPQPLYSSGIITPYMSETQREFANHCQAINVKKARAYWNRARFFNATGRTFESLGGMIWSQEPEVELDASVAYLEKNANGSGMGLRDVAQCITDENISLGRVGALADMPENQRALTRQQMESGENAARIIMYKAESIVYWRTDKSGNLVEVRLIEVHQEEKTMGEGALAYCVNTENVIYTRQLVMIDGVYHNRLFSDKDELISDVIPFANGSAFNFIPFQFFGADKNTPEFGKIPLYDLSSCNIGHYVLDADNRANLHYHGSGMTNVYSSMDDQQFFEKNPNGLDCGPGGMNQLNSDDRVEILQIDSTGAIASEMERDQKRMIMLGGQLVQEANTNQTLGAKEMEFGASVSTLKRITHNSSKGIENLINWCAMFMGSSGESTYRLNTDFVTDNMTPEMINAHFALVQGGVLPVETIYETARKAELTKLDNQEIADLARESDLGMSGEPEELARLRAENEALREQLNGAE
jgi:hypothetical protein